MKHSENKRRRRRGPPHPMGNHQHRMKDWQRMRGRLRPPPFDSHRGGGPRRGGHSHPHPPDWRKQRHQRWQRRRQFMFVRFATIFGAMTLLVLGGVAVSAFLAGQVIAGSSIPTTFWFGGCLLSLALPYLGFGIASRGFRTLASPITQVMEAAETIAGGDLSVRVKEDYPGDFGQLTKTFNHMVEELERAEEQRRNLTADVAHELRTPLHVIQGNLEGIIDGVYEPTDDHIRGLLDETRQLARLIDDLRTLSLAESGQLPLRLEVISLADLLNDAVTSFSHQASEAGITLGLAEGIVLEGLSVEVDVVRINQVIGNLIVNAIHHTPEGGSVTLGARVDNAGVEISIRDTGAGIDPDDLPYIFDRFWRGDSARTHSEGLGGGLGLSIARQLVRLHGGDISVESEAGSGTRFVISLP